MPCQICQGGGDRYTCANEECELSNASFACEHCAEVYDWECPECGAPLVDLADVYTSEVTEEPLMERDEAWVKIIG